MPEMTSTLVSMDVPHPESVNPAIIIAAAKIAAKLAADIFSKNVPGVIVDIKDIITTFGPEIEPLILDLLTKWLTPTPTPIVPPAPSA